MQAEIELLTGERKAPPACDVPARAGPYSELICNDVGLGRYFEAVRLGRVYGTISKAITIAATHNSPIAANTATPVLGFGNVSSNRAAVLLRAGVSNVSGTPAGGQFVLNLQAEGARTITASATGSIFNCLLTGGASPQGSQMKPLSNVALAGWLATPNAVQEIAVLGATSAAAVVGSPGPAMTGEDLGGLFIVPPGGLCAIMAGSGAGTTWVVNASLIWAEVDWPLQ